MTWTILELGRVPTPRDTIWAEDPRVHSVVRYTRAAPSGRRRNSRLLGLGLDASIVAAMALRRRGRGARFLAVNPWTAVALRLLGATRVAAIGIYARPGSASWRVLRRVLGGASIVALSEVEARAWRADGGEATAVRYGNTFPPPATGDDREDEQRQSTSVRVFIGGSSDRDADAIEALVSALRAAPEVSFLLTVAIGGARRVVTAGSSTVTFTGPLTSAEFSRTLAAHEVVYLPLKEGRRAAGHMVVAEALQRGIRVVATPIAGMAEYFDGSYVVRASSETVEQLVSVAARADTDRDAIVEHWRSHFSAECFARAVLDALEGHDR